MKKLFYPIAVLLFVGWLLGSFVWNAGYHIHILIVLAIIFALFGAIRKV